MEINKSYGLALFLAQSVDIKYSSVYLFCLVISVFLLNVGHQGIKHFVRGIVNILNGYFNKKHFTRFTCSSEEWRKVVEEAILKERGVEKSRKISRMVPCDDETLLIGKKLLLIKVERHILRHIGINNLRLVELLIVRDAVLCFEPFP